MNKKFAKELIHETLVKSISDFAEKAVKKKANFQVLDLIIPRERKIRSVVGGLETSLGTTLWEPLAKVLASHNGFEVIEDNLQCPTNMPGNLSSALNNIIEDRERRGGLYDAEASHKLIRDQCQVFINRPINDFENAPRGKGVDIWLKKDETNFFFDTKTVQPNLAALRSCLSQVLYWYAYFYAKNPQGKAESRIVFPYNPYKQKGFWESIIGKGKPLEAHTEAWVENEFWDFCSGLDGTYTLIEQVFIEIQKSKVLEKKIEKMLS